MDSLQYWVSTGIEQLGNIIKGFETKLIKAHTTDSIILMNILSCQF